MQRGTQARRPIAAPLHKVSTETWASLLCWCVFFLVLAFVPDAKVARTKLFACEASLFLCALLALILAARENRGFSATAFDVPVLLYPAAALLFWLRAPEPAAAAPELTRALSCAAAFFAASQAGPRLARPGRLIAAWGASAAALGGYAWLQTRGGLGPLDVPLFARPVGTFGNPIFLGGYLAAALAATAPLALDADAPQRRRALAALLALQAAGLWLCQSRAAFFGAACAAAAWIFARSSGARRAGLLAVLAAACAALAWHFRDRQNTHLLIWSGAWRLWLAHPLLGCGLGRFHLEFPAYAPAELRALWPQGQIVVNFAHNEYLQTLAETGLLGAAALLAAPAALAVWLARRGRQATAPALGAALAAVTVFSCAVFSPGMRFGVASLVAFAALGLAAGLSEPRWRRWPAPPLARAAALACAALALCGWARLAAEPYLAEKRLAQAEEFFGAAPDARAQEEALEQQLAESPGDAAAAESLGYLYAKERRWTLAASRFKLAADLAPADPGPLNNLGNVFYTLGDFVAAEACWRRAVAAAPGQTDAHLNLGKLLYERGRLKEASAELQTALRLSPEDPKARALLKRMVE